MKIADNHSVLIADDESSNIAVLTHILSSEYVIYAAKNGQDAIEAAKEYLPDVILLDILMPDMDGYEVLSMLKRTEETRTIPVIFITGLVSSEDEEKGMALGASDYITKPFSTEIVRLRVRNQMQILKDMNMIDQRLKQQTLMTSISKSFLSGSDIDTLFTNTLCIVGNFMEIAQVLLYDLEEDEVTLTCRNEWINPVYNLPTRINSQILLREPMLSIINGFLPHGPDLCLNSNDPAFKSAMRPYRENFMNYITTPIFIRGKMCAVIDFSKEEDGRNWNESDINLAIHVASILSGVYERNAMERQSSIVENSPQFIIYLSTNGDVSYLNPAASELTGHTKSEIMAAGLELIFSAEAAQLIRNTYIPNTLRNGVCSFEKNIMRKDGETRILSFTSFTAGNGNIGAIAQDVTEIRALQTELITAKELAEQSSRVKSEFLSCMSHEMRTPMNAIIGMTNIAQISDSAEEKADCLKEIYNASQHLLRLIDDVLDLSSLKKHTLSSDHSEFSFRAMLVGLLKTVKLYTTEKHQILSYSIDPMVPSALIGDEKRIAQVINSLLMNANKFTPEQGMIQLNACVSDSENETVILKIEVNDNGIGIPVEKQSIIFDSFEQADGSLTKEFGGAGLGLAISKYIVEMMGGKIWVESEPGQGAKFTFTVKLKRVNNEGSGHNAGTNQ
ncbi:MAG: ATP-binding protein [Synergistaceae bacterium]|nr:ATP-binding protein [Synergistaceae bacterium]